MNKHGINEISLAKILAVYDSGYGLYAAFTMYIITHEFNNIGLDTPCIICNHWNFVCRLSLGAN